MYEEGIIKQMISQHSVLMHKNNIQSRERHFTKSIWNQAKSQSAYIHYHWKTVGSCYIAQGAQLSALWWSREVRWGGKEAQKVWDIYVYL